MSRTPATNKRKKSEASEFQISSAEAYNQNEDNLSECIKKDKRQKIKLRKQRIYKKMNWGSWTLLEESMFLSFIKENRDVFQGKELRRSHKIFRKMRGYIKTRSHEQCRSHHQKYEQRFQHCDELIEYLQAKIEEQKRISQNSSKTRSLIAHKSTPKSEQASLINPHLKVNKLWDDHQQDGKQNMNAQYKKKLIKCEEKQQEKQKEENTRVNAQVIIERQMWKLIRQSQMQLLAQISIGDIQTL